MRRVLTILALTLGAVLQSCQPGFAQTSNYGGVSIAGSYTSNCIPVAVTAVTLQCSGWVDSGTTLTSSEVLLAPNGAVGAPAYSFSGAPTYGWWISGGTVVQLSIAGVAKVAFLNQNLQMGSNGFILFTSTTDPNGTPDTMLTRKGPANFRLGSTDINGVPVSQILSFQNAITGSNLTPGTFTLDAPLGTGTGAGSATRFNRGLMGASGTTAQTAAHAFVICESKTLSNTSATVQALANIALASNSAGGARGSITVTATDGTNFDSETQDFVVSYVNKATVGTVGTAAITASTAANNSGSATIGMTATFAGSTLSINATPVFTTIVPTTVTAYLELQNHGAGAVTCQ